MLCSGCVGLFHCGFCLVQGAVTVFALAIPSVLSLLVLLRNEAARGIEGSKLEWVRARVEEQCKLLEDGLPLTFPLDALLVPRFLPAPLLLPSCLTSLGLCLLRLSVERGDSFPGCAPNQAHSLMPLI